MEVGLTTGLRVDDPTILEDGDHEYDTLIKLVASNRTEPPEDMVVEPPTALRLKEGRGLTTIVAEPFMLFEQFVALKADTV